MFTLSVPRIGHATRLYSRARSTNASYSTAPAARMQR